VAGAAWAGTAIRLKAATRQATKSARMRIENPEFRPSHPTLDGEMSKD